MPKPNKRLEREVHSSGNCLPVWYGQEKFEVTQGFTIEKYVVDLKHHTYNCYFWNLVSIPYRYVVDAINYKLE